MATIENFILRFKVEGQETLNNVKQGIKGLRDDMNNFANVGGPLNQTLDGVIGRLGPMGIAAATAGVAFAGLGLRAINAADELSDLSDATGIGADQLFNLQQSMMLAGGNSESMAKSVSKLSVAIGESMGGNDKYQKSFKDLGVIIRDSSGEIRNSGDILQDVLASLAKIEDPAVRAAKAVELLGKEAAKIDWSNVKAGKDAVKAEQIAALAKYRDEIDRLRKSIDDALITAFGKLAIAINKINWAEETQKLTKYLSALSPLIKMLNIAQQAAPMREQAQREANAELLRESRRGQRPEVTGDQGGLSEAKLKALAESRLRIEQSSIEARKQLEIRGQGDIAQIEINAKYEAQKATKEIIAKGNALGLDFSKEAAAKEKEIYAKRDSDIAKNRQQTQIRIMNEQMALEEQNAKDLAAYYQQVDQARLSAFDQVKTLKDQTDELQARFNLQQSIVDLSSVEQDRQTKIFDAIQQQKSALDALANIKLLPNDERLKREQEINAEYEKRIGLINTEADARITRENDFSAGVKESMKRYQESLTPLKQGQQVADSVFGNMTSALDNFVNTGKFNFKDFAASVVQDLIKIQLRAAATQLFTSVLGMFGFTLPGRAIGGPVSQGKPYLVGERGPELFMPNSSGNIVSNDKLKNQTNTGLGSSTTINYNISAIDSRSVAQFFAENRMTMLGTVEQARRELPLRTR